MLLTWKICNLSSDNLVSSSFTLSNESNLHWSINDYLTCFFCQNEQTGIINTWLSEKYAYRILINITWFGNILKNISGSSFWSNNDLSPSKLGPFNFGGTVTQCCCWLYPCHSICDDISLYKYIKIHLFLPFSSVKNIGYFDNNALFNSSYSWSCSFC